jgi:hypothetical protein
MKTLSLYSMPRLGSRRLFEKYPFLAIARVHNKPYRACWSDNGLSFKCSRSTMSFWNATQFNSRPLKDTWTNSLPLIRLYKSFACQ